MYRILDRYILREVAQTWLSVTSVLLCILLTNQFARVLGDVAKDKLPKEAIFELISLTGVQYLTILIPIGLFLSILLALGRLYADSEMSAMMACSIGPIDIYRSLFWLVLPLIICVAWLSINITPKALASIDRISAEARRQADLASIEAGKFVVNNVQKTVIYAEKILESGQIENVFLQHRTEDGGIEVVVAQRGEQRQEENKNMRYFVLYDGKRYRGHPGSSEFLVIEFAEHGIPYSLPALVDQKLEPREMFFLDLVNSDDKSHLAELHWRIGLPISTLILFLLAIPMSRSQPRQGRYTGIAMGILVFIIYFNLLSTGKSWLENGLIPAGAGIWWVHSSVLLAAIGMLIAQNGLHREIFKGKKS